MDSGPQGSTGSGSATEQFPQFSLLPDGLKAAVAGFLDLRTAASACAASRSTQVAAKSAVWRGICCSACGHVLLHPRSVVPPASSVFGGPKLRLQDGEAIQVNVDDSCGISLGDEYSTNDDLLRYQAYNWLGVRAAVLNGYVFRVRAVHCGGCGLYVGCRFCGVQGGGADHDGNDSDSDPEDGNSPTGADKLTDTLHIASAYIHTAKRDGSPAEDSGGSEALAEYICRGARGMEDCGNVLFRRRDILSQKHMWDCGGGPEEAWFVNSVAPGSVEARSKTTEQLAQGSFDIQKTFCRCCGAEVGWKFSKNLELTSQPRTHDCRRYEGRFGFVASKVTLSGS